LREWTRIATWIDGLWDGWMNGGRRGSQVRRRRGIGEWVGCKKAQKAQKMRMQGWDRRDTASGENWGEQPSRFLLRMGRMGRMGRITNVYCRLNDK